MSREKHHITRNDFMVSANGERPWHGLGLVLEKPALTAHEALTLARLDWRVEEAQIHDVHGPLPNYKSLRRSDINTVLSIVSKDYSVLQNQDAFAFFDSIVERGDAIYETAGSVMGGRKIFLCAKMPRQIELRLPHAPLNAPKIDLIDKYILLANTHDATRAAIAKVTPIRVVCNNTFQRALNTRKKGEVPAQVSITHTGDMASKLKLAANLLGLVNTQYEQFAEEAQHLANKTISSNTARSFFEELVRRKLLNTINDETLQEATEGLNAIDTPSDASNLSAAALQAKQKAKVAKHVNTLIECYENGLGAQPGSAWGAINAVLEYVDHTTNYKTADGRMNAAMFTGGPQNLKGYAYAQALKL